MFTAKTLRDSENENFWEWRNSAQFDLFVELLISILLDENDALLRKYLNIGEEAASTRLAKLQLANALRNFPKSHGDFAPSSTSDNELASEDYA